MSLTKDDRQSIARAETMSGKIREVLDNMKESDSKINLANVADKLAERRAKKKNK